ncbi:MAG TPA: hypothetical protein VLI06_19555 [Solimonas sp.]|nr:hypothetical protein [Solimonas sp.]
MRPKLLMLALLWSAAAAAAPLVTERPVPWNGGAVKLGDSEAQVRAVAGKYPDRTVPLNPGENLPIGEQWTFIGHGKPSQTLWVELIRGRVTRVWTEPFDASGKANLQ